MQRVLITGAETPAGRELARRLCADGYAVRALVPPGAIPDSFEGCEEDLVVGELTDAHLVGKLLADVQGVVHLYVRGAPPEGVSESANLQHNLLGTLNLVQQAAERGGVERFVCGSSSSVYPNDTHQLAALYHPVDEDHPLRPLDAYGLARVGAERIAWAYARSHGLPVCVIRESGVATPADVLGRWTVEFVGIILGIGYQNPASEIYSEDIPAALEDLRARAESPDQPCAVTDRQGRPWLYQLVDYRDLTSGLACALTHPAAAGGTYNIAAARPLSYVDAARVIGAKTGRRVLEWQAPVRWVFDLDCTRARVEIGYRPHWNIKRMVESALEG